MGNLNKKSADKQLSAEEEAIQRFVKTLLANPKINLSFVPDKMERDVYESVLQSLLESLKVVAGSTRIELLNHVITFQVTPVSSSSST
jgi:hypothetical protein